MPIYWAAGNIFTLQILQPVRVIRESLRDSESPNPQGFKFTMFVLVLFRSIPFQHQVSYLEPLLLSLLIKTLLDPLLMVLNSNHYLLSGLLDFYQLMNPSDHVIGLSLIILEEFLYGNSQLRREDSFCYVN